MNDNEFEKDIGQTGADNTGEPAEGYSSADEQSGAGTDFGAEPQSGADGSQASQQYTYGNAYSGNSYRNPYNGNTYNAGAYNGGVYNSGVYGGQNGTPYSTPAPPVPEEGKKGMGKGAKITIAVIVMLALAAVAAVIIGFAGLGGEGDNNNTKPAGDSPTLGISDNEGKGEVSADGISSVQVAEEARKSVVGVTVYRNKKVVSEGSGIIMETDDAEYTYVITCAHVVDMQNTGIEIQLYDETTIQATVVGLSSRDDIGVLKVKKKGLPAAKFADSSKLKVGERVYAIGNPGGSAFSGSFTGGFVSAIDRQITTNSIGYTMQCIQHDAAINPGNSGGALVNSNGYVVGINSSKIMSEEYEGMAFAIPITPAKEIIDSIIANGYVPNQPKLGISYASASSSQTYSMIVQIKKLPAGSIVVRGIDADSDLVNSELQAGDMITAVNGKEMSSSRVLAEIIENSNVGDEITLSVCRVDDDFNISEFTVKAKLVEDKQNPSVNVDN